VFIEDISEILPRTLVSKSLPDSNQQRILLEKVKIKECPRGFQEVKVPIFHDNSTGWW